MLTPRQQIILRSAIELYLDVGDPVSSKWLASRDELNWGSSTIRNELALLEQQGLLAHPHTSAGRVPTDAGYRYFVDHLLGQTSNRPLPELDLSLMRQEVDTAMQATTEALSQVTDLLAVVSAPPLDTATIRHIEVLALQTRVLMVVVITSTGGVTKRVLTFDRPIDPGLVNWAGSYLNERLIGTGLGARMLHHHLVDPELSALEKRFIQSLSPAFSELEDRAPQQLYVEGTTRLLTEHRIDNVGEINELIELLEQRVTLLDVLRQTLSKRDLVIRIGGENETPALRSLALISCGYGLPQRNLGTVSVIGPLRMDYATAIGSVREAAQQLSHFALEVYVD